MKMPYAQSPTRLTLRALLFLGGALMLTCATLAQSSSDAAVEQLRQRLMSGSAAAVVHVSNLHGTTRALVRPVDNLVVNGTVQSRPVIGLLRGADETIQAGQPVRILSVETVVGKKNDLLRVTVITPGNAIAPVAFQLPADALRTITEAQLEALVFPVLTPANAGKTTGRTDSKPRAGQPSAPAGWVVRQTPAGTEAVLRGTAESAGHSAPALLVLGCPTTQLSQDRPVLLPFVELRLPKSSVTFDVLFVGEKDGDDNGYVRVQIGTSPEIKADLATWTLIPEMGNVASLGLDLRRQELEKITLASAAPLRVAVLPTDKPETGVTARFALPADVTAEQAAMTPCLEKAKAAEATLHASRAVECPELSNLVLLNADVRRAATGKSLAADPERDQGVGWPLPKPTKAHPIVPKTVLACIYGPPDQKAEPRKTTRVETLPIPQGASYCESWIETTENRSRAYCEWSLK